MLIVRNASKWTEFDDSLIKYLYGCWALFGCEWVIFSLQDSRWGKALQISSLSE